MKTSIFDVLKDYRVKHLLTVQEYRTLKGQAVHGNIEAAEKGLKLILERKSGGSCGNSGNTKGNCR